MLPWTFQFQTLHWEIFGLLPDKSSSCNFKGIKKKKLGILIVCSFAPIFFCLYITMNTNGLFMNRFWATLSILGFLLPVFTCLMTSLMATLQKKGQQEEVNSSTAPTSTPSTVLHWPLSTVLHWCYTLIWLFVTALRTAQLHFTREGIRRWALLGRVCCQLANESVTRKWNKFTDKKMALYVQGTWVCASTCVVANICFSLHK